MSRVWVAMSGGVDSAVAAHEMLSQGHTVTGVTLRLPHAGIDPADDPIDAAAAVCDALGIEHIVLDAREVFDLLVIEPYVAAYAHGLTPNPCVLCNEDIKFDWLLSRALAAGAETLVTGHYARIVAGNTGLCVARAHDPDKDQSYFLYALSPAVLEHVAFPLGATDKSWVRARAKELDLPVAHRPESQEACFVGVGGIRELVARSYPDTAKPGEIVDVRGEVVGVHRGIASYTVGQRKGLGIGGLAEPLFVLAIDGSTNRIVVGPESDLYVTRVIASSVIPGFAEESQVEAMIRYRMDPVPARIERVPEGLSVTFDTPVRAVAPGQSVVCYVGDCVVAGGEIVCAS